MKKLILSFFAVASLFSCSKSDIIYSEQEAHIGFSPIANTIVKSVANSTNTENFAYPTNLDLYVFANAQADDLSQSWPSPYFTNAKFIYNRLNNNVYEGDPARFWPNVKSLIFAGYSGNVGTLSTDPTMNFDSDILTIEDYIQDNAKGYTTSDSDNSTTSVVGGNDLMWFSKTTAYTKQAAAIPVTMHHACSWITVKVVGDEVTGGEWILKELKINNLYHEGTAQCGASSASWTTSGDRDAEILYSNGTTAIPTIETGAQTYENVADNMVVIPQVPTTIDVTYSFVPQEGVDPITETTTGLSLSIGKDAQGQELLWESGKHYIYTITITATEILIDPKVDVWTPHTVTPGTTI